MRDLAPAASEPITNIEKSNFRHRAFPIPRDLANIIIIDNKEATLMLEKIARNYNNAHVNKHNETIANVCKR